ncbi:MAG: putative toxin-antitoxin system toxin component, PIN family [Methylococcaceae bacterium]|nr:putative toxin-antitoxin system toxin component, PIN family [Methylococcaceae bacterium]MCI0733475.1 putative toxin-antitoxin system toxin component, PIN family [Methylococcaceae bacterium]
MSQVQVVGYRARRVVCRLLPWCETVSITEPPPLVPACRDPCDQPFLELAVAGNADFLVMGDADLLALAEDFICPIVNVAEFLEILDRPA